MTKKVSGNGDFFFGIRLSAFGENVAFCLTGNVNSPDLTAVFLFE